MRRALTVLLGLAVSVGVGSAATAQADELVVVHGSGFSDSRTGAIVGRSCAAPTQDATGGPFHLRVDPTDDETPLGTHMVGFDTGGGSALGPVAFTDDPATSAWNVRFRTLDARSEGMYVAFYVAPSDPAGYWVGHAPVTVEGPGWSTLDGTGVALTWQYRRDGADVGAPQPAQTLAAFVAAQEATPVPDPAPDPASDQPSDQPSDQDSDQASEPTRGVAMLGMAFGCDDSHFYFDALRVGAPGSVVTHDFEQ